MRQFLLTSFLVFSLVVPAVTLAQTTTPPAPTDQQSATGFNVESVKAWFSKTHAKIEVFRKKQSVYFVAMREEYREKLNIGTPAKDPIIDIGIGADIEKKDAASSALDNPLDYIKYIFAISMASMFTNTLVFYISTLLLTLIILRFVISRLV